MGPFPHALTQLTLVPRPVRGPVDPWALIGWQAQRLFYVDDYGCRMDLDAPDLADAFEILEPLAQLREFGDSSRVFLRESLLEV